MKTISEPIENIETTLNNITHTLARFFNADSVFIYILDEEKKKLVLMASSTPHPKEIRKLTINPGEGITGWVAVHKEPVAIDEKAYEDKRFLLFQNLPEDRFEAFLSCPIISNGKVIGVLNIQHKNPKKHTKNEILIVSLIAISIGSAIEKIKQLEEIQRYKEEIEARKIIEKAKGILMKKRNMDEATAYRFIQKLAMDRRITMKEVAESILLMDELNI
ncbi:MAG: ANTAR domain-containing protein [bacterium]|nr:ANTAR domain-containing protein [bacterium]